MDLKSFIVFVLFLVMSGAAFSQSSAELKRRKASLSKEIESLKREQRKIAGNKRSSLKQIEALNAQIRLREEKINTINSEVRLLSHEIAEKSNTVQSLQSQLNELKKQYAAMVLFAFRSRSAYQKVMFVFAAENFNQAYKRLKYLQQFSKHRKKQATYIRETQKDLGMKIVELDKDKRSKKNLLESQETEKITLSKEKIEEAQQVKKLTKQEQLVKKQVDTKRKEVSRLNSAISNAIKREIAAARAAAAKAAAAKAAAEKLAAQKAAAARAAEAKRTGTTAPASSPKPVEKTTASSKNVLSSTPATAKLSSGFLNNRGRLPWPASGTVVSRYGKVKYGNVYLNNTGIDIKTSPGASVSAIFSGEVIRVDNISGYFIIIRHGEYFSVYSNLRSVNVSQGQSVSTGQSLGSVKTNPDDGTTRLHFEIWRGTSPTNPEGWLN